MTAITTKFYYLMVKVADPHHDDGFKWRAMRPSGWGEKPYQFQYAEACSWRDTYVRQSGRPDSYEVVEVPLS